MAPARSLARRLASRFEAAHVARRAGLAALLLAMAVLGWQARPAALQQQAPWAAVAVLAVLLAGGAWRHRRLWREQRAALDRLAASNRRLSELERALDAHAVVAVTDVKGHIVHANEHFCALSKYPLQELLGRNHRIVKSDVHDPPFFKDMWRTIARGQVWHGEVCNRAKDGTLYWLATTIVPCCDERGKPCRYISIRTDISSRKHAEAQLRRTCQRLNASSRELARLAAIDPLTGLANRRQFDEALAREFRRAQRNTGSLAALMVDVDHFKCFNDTYGHAAGDVCLQRVADAVRGVPRRPGDFAARWGGEEFVLLLPQTDVAGALLVAEELRQAVQALAIEHRGSPLGCVSVSIGVHAVRPGAGVSAQALMVDADRALYQAKFSGRNRARALDLGAAACACSVDGSRHGTAQVAGATGGGGRAPGR